MYLSCRTDVETGRDTHSELWQAMPDLDVEGLMNPWRISKYYGDYRTLPVLYVCRDWYKAAIPLWYGQYTFSFETPAALRFFSNNAWEMHNNEFVRDIRIVVNAWNWRECMQPGGRGPYLHAPNWLEWMEFFEEEDRCLLWPPHTDVEVECSNEEDGVTLLLSSSVPSSESLLGLLSESSSLNPNVLSSDSPSQKLSP